MIGARYGRGIVSVWGWFACLSLPPAYAQRPGLPTPAIPLVLDSVTVVDVEAGRLVPAQRVVIVGNRLQVVGAVAETTVPPGARLIDARGKYVMPGLWDMHIHVDGYPEVVYPLLIANGVTGARDMHMGERLDSLLRWRREIMAGVRPGPRLVVTGNFLGSAGNGTMLSTGKDLGTMGIPVPTPERGREVVDSLQRAGVDFIKVRDGLSREVYFAVMAEARRIGVPVVGHLSGSVTLAEASDSGQRTIEHQIHACTDDAQCAALATRFRRNGTWLTPTFIGWRYALFEPMVDRLRLWPEEVGAGLFDIVSGIRKSTAEMDVWAAGEIVPQIALLARAGMPLLAGTDMGTMFPDNTPGFSLHEELELLARGGMSTADVLRTATLNPAKYLHATDSLGSVATGKLADLVLLDADPLQNVHNTTAIRAVVANGRYFDRAALDAMVVNRR